MTPREHYFSVVEGKKPINMPFVPDITDWYTGRQTPDGEARKFGAAEYIPDSDPIKNYNGKIPAAYRDWSLLDFYRNFGWGFHAHIGDWYETNYTNCVHCEVVKKSKEFTKIYTTPKGTLTRTYKLAMDGTWCPVDYLLKTPEDFKIWFYVLNSETYKHTPENSNRVLDGIGNMGQADLVLYRSPFGKLIHEHLGFMETAYALEDDPALINEYLALQTKKDMELVNLACQDRARLVIISDHADQTLISKNWYQQYCIPFYQEACGKLHQHGKIVSTHLDGNFKAFFPLLGQTGFDVLDGCTPAPMFNYEIEELADALPDNMTAFIGVASTLFCYNNATTDDILAYVDRILTAFKGKGIINVGDILSPDGDIEKVIALGEYIKQRTIA